MEKNGFGKEKEDKGIKKAFKHKPVVSIVWMAFTFTVVLPYCNAEFLFGKLRCVIINIFYFYLEI